MEPSLTNTNGALVYSGLTFCTKSRWSFGQRCRRYVHMIETQRNLDHFMDHIIAGLTPEFAMIIDNITNFVFRTMESQRSRSYTKCQRLDTYLCNGELTRTIKFDKFQTIFTNFHLNIYDALFETKGIEVISLQLDKGFTPLSHGSF